MSNNKIPKKYLKGLSEKDKEKKKENIKKTKEELKKGNKQKAAEIAKKRPTTKDNKESSNTIKFKKKFGDDVKPNTKKFADKTGIPLSIQKEVIKRGKGAFLSSGSRPSVSSPTQWGIARLYAFYFKGISGKLNFDKDLAEKVKFKK
jgi:hypothetical protein